MLSHLLKGSILDVLIPENNTPDNNIVIFRHEQGWVPKDSLEDIIKRPPKTRDWFSPNFYRCLPLTIGNLYGFTIHSAFSFNAMWNGGNEEESISFTYFEPEEERRLKFPLVKSHFGHGIISVVTPFHLKTPKGVNLMTINPTNYVIPNITVMTGVIESDNIQRDFTLNLRIQEPNRIISIKKGDPLTTVIPIPRYYQDNFVLKVAEEVFEESVVNDEVETAHNHHLSRHFTEQEKAGRHYLTGQNIYGETFPDHQTTIDYEA